MKRTSFHTIGLVIMVGLLTVVLFYALTPAQAGAGTFRTGIANLLATEFTAAQSNRIGNAFADQYQAQQIAIEP